MKLNCDLLSYLDHNGYLVEMKIRAEEFLQGLTENNIAKFPPFRFLLEMDVMDLCDSIPDAGEWLLKEPAQFQNACSEILFACVQSANGGSKSIEQTQVAVNLRLRSIPHLTAACSYAGLTYLCGLLVSMSKPESYVYHTVWSCPEECEGNEVILQFIPKLPPKCYVCKSILFENSGLRRCGERVLATFQLKRHLLPKTIAIVDDLIPKLKLGAIYNIHVATTKKAMKVWALEQVVGLAAPITASIPSDIKDLYKACKGVTWKFIYCLASSIGVNVCPLNCFIHLKICLLLSLTSVRANALTGSPIVHVLAGGYDSGYVGRLMQSAAELAETATFLGTTNTAASAALVGSSGGVCVMPLPFHTYKQKQSSLIISAIESGQFAKDTGVVKLRSAVWAQGMDFKKVVLLNISGVFGALCRGDYGEYNDEIVDFVLQNAIEPAGSTKEEVQALKDVVQYMDAVAGIEVTLDGGAESLLRQYFLAARRERARLVAAGSLGALWAATAAAARVCRRRVAARDDAVFAIWLHVCGTPEPRVAPDEYLQAPADIKRLHTMMEDFKHWLEQFTGICLS